MFGDDAEDVFETPVDSNCVVSITEAIHEHFDLATARRIIRDFKRQAGLRQDQEIPARMASALYGTYVGEKTDCGCVGCTI